MYRLIVLAYDGTVEGRRALREGALLARCCGSEVHLISIVANHPGARMADGVYGGASAIINDGAKRIFEEGLEHLRALGFDPVSMLTTGEPAQIISDYVARVRADLVVVGHRRQSLIERWWSGSNGAYLADALGCSLLIGRTDVSEDTMRSYRLRAGRERLESVESLHAPVVGSPLSPVNRGP